MNSTPRWDDYRLVLAIVESGSLSGAARRLGVNHATIFRRLSALESRVGTRCFERHGGRYVTTISGETIATTARRMHLAVTDAERALMGNDTALTGTLRITTTDALLGHVLMPMLAKFQKAHPGLLIEATTSPELHNLTRRDADIALRPTLNPLETLTGKELGRLRQAIYISDNTLMDESTPWVGPDASMSYHLLERWMKARGFDQHITFRADSTLGMAFAIQAGLGQGVLPCYLAEKMDGLARVSDPISELEAGVWLLTHPDIRHAASVNAFFAALVDSEWFESPI